MQRNPERGRGEGRGAATVAVGSDSKVYLHLTLNTLPESATTTRQQVEAVAHEVGADSRGCCSMEGGKHDSCINFDCVNILSVRIAERCAKLFGQCSALSGDCQGKYLRRGMEWSDIPCVYPVEVH